MTATAEETTTIEDLDFDPPCEYGRHESHVHSTSPAEWIIRARKVCPHAKTTVLMCDPCWNYLNSSADGLVMCVVCRVMIDILHLIIRREPIR